MRRRLLRFMLMFVAAAIGLVAIGFLVQG